MLHSLPSAVPPEADPDLWQLPYRYRGVWAASQNPGRFSIWQLYTLGYLEYANARPNNLTSPIHPVIDLEKWRRSPIDPNAKPLEDEDRRLIEPVLRLASAMFLSSVSVAFLHNVIYGKRHHLKEVSIRYKTHLYALDAPPRPCARMKNEFDEVISQISPHVHLYTTDFQDRESMGLHLNGRCKYIRNSKISFSESTRLRKGGRGSNIQINDAFLRQLRNLEKSETLKDINHTLRIQFGMALTICHELNHAVNAAVKPRKHGKLHSVEPFCKDHNISELGFSWEEEVFDGLTHRMDSDHQWQMGVYHFPEPYHYRDKYGRFKRGEPPKSFTVYWLSMKWLARLNRQSAWNRWNQTQDPKLLHIPRSVGVQLTEIDGKPQTLFEWDRALLETGETAVAYKPGWIRQWRAMDGHDVTESDLDGDTPPGQVHSNPALDADFDNLLSGIAGLDWESDSEHRPAPNGEDANQVPNPEAKT